MKICCVFNYNPSYRLPIYSAMDKEFDCDFYFGDTVFQPLKSFDPTELKGFKGFMKTKRIKSYFWHSGISKIFSKKYTHYIVTGSVSLLVTWLILFYAKLTGKKVYLWAHGIKNETITLKENIIFKLFFKRATGILMYNSYFCKNMTKIGCKKERLHVIHNSLDTELQTSIYSGLSQSDIYKKYFKNDNPTILYIGRIQRVKKTEQILEAMHILKQRGIELNLVVIGSNVDDDVFEKKMYEYELEKNVWMYGPCFDEEKNAELIYNAKVCVSPGNVGLTCMHVLSYGTPVITNNNFSKQMPEFEAIIEGKTGSFFQEDDVDDLAKHIQNWVLLPDEERQECRSIARKSIIEDWSVDYQINLLKNILN